MMMMRTDSQETAPRVSTTKERKEGGGEEDVTNITWNERKNFSKTSSQVQDKKRKPTLFLFIIKSLLKSLLMFLLLYSISTS